jgi:hypothetical protein
MYTKFWSEHLKARNSGVDERIILRLISTRLEYEDVEWIHLAHDTVQWLSLVNVVMNLHISVTSGEYLDHPSDY